MTGIKFGIVPEEECLGMEKLISSPDELNVILARPFGAVRDDIDDVGRIEIPGRDKTPLDVEFRDSFLIPLCLGGGHIHGFVIDFLVARPVLVEEIGLPVEVF